MKPTDQSLWCENCRAQYEVGFVESGRTYRCARCRQSILEPADALATTWLYAARPSTQTAPTLDDARTTWSDTQATTEQLPAKKFGRFELSEEIGRGGMGVVYRAWDPESQQNVALKVLIGGRWADRTAIERFLREAAAAARLNHPGLVRVVDHGEWDGQPYYAMELIAGPSLKDVLDDIGRPPVQETVRIGAALARALEHAHQQGVSHRDVKPENVLLRITGEPVLTDFGLVLERDHARLTRTGQVMGTPAYLAPELARGDKEPDWPKVDIYALGALLYELSTGRPAYDGDSGMQVLMDVLDGPPAHPRSVDPELPKDLDTVIQRAMARFASERTPSAGSLATDLDRIRLGAQIEARPFSAAYRTRLWFDRNGRTASVAGLAVVLTCSLLAIGVGARTRIADAAQSQAWQDAERRLADLQPELDRLEAEGQRVEVELALDTFLQNDRWQGSPATSEALRLHARRLRERGDSEAELEALAVAWVTAPNEASAATSLDSLIEGLTARWWYERVETLSQGLSGEGLDARRALAAVARRDLDAAALAWSSLPDGAPSSAALVKALLMGAPTEHRAREVHRIDDQRLLLVGRDGLRVVEARPGLPLIETWDVGRRVGHAWPAGDDRLITWADGRAELLVRVDQRWTVALAWPESRILDVTTLQLDGTSAILVAVGPYSRRIVRLDTENGLWTQRSAHAATDSTTSDIVALEAGELDGDGQPDLLVSAGPWNAFDVRWLAASDGELTLKARRKFGYVSDLAIVQWAGEMRIAASKSDQYPSRRTFPAGKPYGEPAGLWILAADPSLSTVHHRRLTGPVGEVPPGTDRLISGDFDGDGRTDIAIGARTKGDQPWMLLYRQGADGQPHHARLRGLQAMASAQLDDDRAHELIVGVQGDDPDGERQLWTLGTGSTSLPAVPRVRHAQPAAPTSLPPELARSWMRADRLASAGLFAQSAAVFERLARAAASEDQADAALIRAASLWGAAGRPDRSESVARDVRSPERRAEALDLRARALLRDYRFADAEAIDRELLALETAPPTLSSAAKDRQPLYAMHSVASPIRFEFDGPLDEQWAIPRTVAVRRDSRAGTLIVDTVVGTGSVASFPLHREGDVLELVVEGQIDRVEWASGLAVQLESADGTAALGVRVAGWGGGSLLETQLGCVFPARPLVGPRAPAEPGDVIPFRARIQVAPRLHEISCLIEGGHGERLVDERMPLRAALPDGDWSLVIRSAGEATVGTPMHARATIDRIALRGASPRVEPPPSAVGRHYAEGDIDAALALLPSGSSVDRAVLLAEVGRTEEAQDTVPDLEDGETDWMLLMRARPQVASDLRPTFGVAWYPMWHQAWNVAVVSHPDDGWVQRRLLQDLRGLGTWRPTDADGRAVRMELLAARGRARWLAGQGSSASRDLESAIAEAAGVIEAADRAGDGPRLRAGRLVWMDGYANLAAIALASNDEQGALAAARQSLVHAPYRELAIDRLSLHPLVAERRSDPAWADLFEATD